MAGLLSNYKEGEWVNWLVEVEGVEDIGEIYGMVATTEPKTMQISGALTDEAVRNGSIKKIEKRRKCGGTLQGLEVVAESVVVAGPLVAELAVVAGTLNLSLGMEGFTILDIHVPLPTVAFALCCCRHWGPIKAIDIRPYFGLLFTPELLTLGSSSGFFNFSKIPRGMGKERPCGAKKASRGEIGVLGIVDTSGPPAVREEMNAYDNSTAMERAWFSIARGAMAQTDALLRFEALYDAHLALKERCEDVTRQLKDSALVFSDRVSNERAVENERLVSKLGYLEKEKIDSIGKLLPTVVRRLLNSHEYKESLSIPFNLAIQAGWAKGLAVKRSEEDLMDVLREVQGKSFRSSRRDRPEAPKDVSCHPPQEPQYC
ncbi:hypothetical protein Tco_1140639 [Tanacetum coccineum]